MSRVYLADSILEQRSALRPQLLDRKVFAPGELKKIYSSALVIILIGLLNHGQPAALPSGSSTKNKR
jgi:hypothetical protein